MTETERMKERLSNYQYCDLEVKRMKKEVRKFAKMLKMTECFDEGGGKEKIIPLCVKLNEVIKNNINECAKIKRRIFAISDERMRKLFFMRYIKGEKFDEIAKKLFFDPDSKGVYKMHSKGLSELIKKNGYKKSDA